MTELHEQTAAIRKSFPIGPSTHNAQSSRLQKTSVSASARGKL